MITVCLYVFRSAFVIQEVNLLLRLKDDEVQRVGLSVVRFLFVTLVVNTSIIEDPEYRSDHGNDVRRSCA